MSNLNHGSFKSFTSYRKKNIPIVTITNFNKTTKNQSRLSIVSNTFYRKNRLVIKNKTKVRRFFKTFLHNK